MNTRPSKQFAKLWGLARNPFPEQAIASAGDSSHPFYSELHPGLARRMARAFIGDNGTPPRASFLWSLGEGEEARGYGKTTYLQWFADRVNADLGNSVLRLAGRTSCSDSWLAACAAFNSVEGLSLSNLLFDVVRDLSGARRDLIGRLREDAQQQGRTADKIYSRASLDLAASGEEWSFDLLHKFCYAAPENWSEYLNSTYQFSPWHKVRYGRRLLRTAVAFVRQLNIDHLLILIDQVEDFASFSTPSYKLRRDLPRLAYLCCKDPIMRGRISFVLTMHPRAARTLYWHWPENDLGSLSSGGTPDNVVYIGAMAKAKFRELVKRYLDEVRVRPSSHTVEPFSEDAVDFVHEINGGRPGHCLQSLFLLIDAAVRSGAHTIDRKFAAEFFSQQGDSQ